MQKHRSEEELVRRSRRGDEDAFLELYLQHRDKIYGFAYRMLGERLTAEDITQECFLTLAKQLNRYDPARAVLDLSLCRYPEPLLQKT